MRYQHRILHGNVKAEWTNIDEEYLPFGVCYHLADIDCIKITITYENRKHQFRKVE